MKKIQNKHCIFVDVTQSMPIYFDDENELKMFIEALSKYKSVLNISIPSISMDSLREEKNE